MSDPNTKLVILLAKEARKAGISLSLSKPVPVSQSFLLASQIADMNAARIRWAFVQSPGPSTMRPALRRRHTWIELWRTPVKQIKSQARDFGGQGVEPQHWQSNRRREQTNLNHA